MRFLTRLLILILFISIYTIHIQDVGDSTSQEKGDGEDVSDRNKRATAETEYTDKTDYGSFSKCGNIVYDSLDDVTSAPGRCYCKDNVTRGTHCCVPTGGGQCQNWKYHGYCPNGETIPLTEVCHGSCNNDYEECQVLGYYAQYYCVEDNKCIPVSTMMCQGIREVLTRKKRKCELSHFWSRPPPLKKCET